jgi:hypothetical protein
LRWQCGTTCLRMECTVGMTHRARPASAFPCKDKLAIRHCAYRQCSTAQLEGCWFYAAFALSLPPPVLSPYYVDISHPLVSFLQNVRSVGNSAAQPFIQGNSGVSNARTCRRFKSLHRGPRPHSNTCRATGGSCFCKMNRCI